MGTRDTGHDPDVDPGCHDAVDRSAADDEQVLSRQERERESFFGGAGYVDARHGKVGSRENDVDPPGKRTADGLEGAASHHQGMPRGGLAEVAHVLGIMPRKSPGPTDRAVGIDSNNARDHQTATGAEIFGCGSYPSRTRLFMVKRSKASRPPPLSVPSGSTMRRAGKGLGSRRSCSSTCAKWL